MKNFDNNDLKLLRRNAGAIGKTIPSKRSRTGYLSARYVSMVIRGQVTCENKTTKAIWEKAENIINTLKA